MTQKYGTPLIFGTLLASQAREIGDFGYDLRFRASKEESRRLFVLGESVEVSRSGIKKGVCGRCCCGQDDDVDD